MSDKISDWARVHGGDYDDGEYEEAPPAARTEMPANPMQPYLNWQRAQVHNALVRACAHKRKAGAYGIRAVIGFVVWQFHFGFWPSLIAICVMMICGLMAMMHAEAWNMARIESRMEP